MPLLEVQTIGLKNGKTVIRVRQILLVVSNTLLAQDLQPKVNMKQVRQENNKIAAAKKETQSDALQEENQQAGKALGRQNKIASKHYKEALKIMRSENPDPERAAELLFLGFESGSTDCMYALGTWYLHGEHLSKNIRKGIQLLRMASKDNHSHALYDLAVCHEEGVGTKVSETSAFECYTKSMLYGDKQSIYEVGRCFYYGIGVEQNRRAARVYLDYAKSLGIE